MNHPDDALTLGPGGLAGRFLGQSAAEGPAFVEALPAHRTLRQALDEPDAKTGLPFSERLLILRALDRAQGNQTVAARLLGMHRNTLLVKLGQLGLRATEPGGAQPASSS